jgi:hypothetical protein
MSRKPRVYFPEAVYHVICPGGPEAKPKPDTLPTFAERERFFLDPAGSQ